MELRKNKRNEKEIEIKISKDKEEIKLIIEKDGKKYKI